MGKNVLLINNGYPSERHPQYTTYIRSIEDCLIASGLNVEKLVIRYDRHITPLYKLYKYFLFWIKCLTIRTDCDTIYINHLPFALPIILNPSLARKKLIVHWHGNDLAGYNKFVKFASRFLGRFVSKAHNIVPSLYSGQELTARYGNHGLRVSVSPSGGVDISNFSPAKTIRKKFVISYASELKREKGIGIFLYLINNRKEIERLTGRSIEFHYVKYGSELAGYLPVLDQYDKNIVKGFDKMLKDDVPAFLNSTDLLVFPSLRDSLGLTALEAMSCGVPVVAHNICAFPEYIKSGVSGELVELKDSESEQNREFLDMVVKVVNNRDSYTPRQIVEANYSRASVISFYRKLFETL
ncbi:MAG: glycosyltransferase family 4 protein [Bacteroides sp.]|nr:glycosyltransferase family 4 protein [Bacteroides sp.]